MNFQKYKSLFEGIHKLSEPQSTGTDEVAFTFMFMRWSYCRVCIPQCSLMLIDDDSKILHTCFDLHHHGQQAMLATARRVVKKRNVMRRLSADV